MFWSEEYTVRRHNNDLRASVKNTHRLCENNETYCKFFLLSKSISWPSFIRIASKLTETKFSFL